MSKNYPDHYLCVYAHNEIGFVLEAVYNIGFPSSDVDLFWAIYDTMNQHYSLYGVNAMDSWTKYGMAVYFKVETGKNVSTYIEDDDEQPHRFLQQYCKDNNLEV